MEKKKITRVISSRGQPKAAPVVEEKLEEVVEAPIAAKEGSESYKDGVKAKKGCSFCQGKTKPLYTDISTLRRFLTERSKIVPKMRSGVCSKHQRAVSRNVKYARHLALLPFVPKI